MRARLLACLLSLALGCLAGCATDPVPDLTAHESGPPHAFKYTIGFSSGAELVTYESRDDFVSKQSAGAISPGGDRADAVVRRRPSAAEWERFWQAVSRLKIWEWQRSYDPLQARPRTVIASGTCWELFCERGPQRVKATGCNAYPRLGDPQRTTLDDAAVAQLEHALDELVDPSVNRAR